MHGMKEIIEEAQSLPVEKRVIVIDSLLQTLNPPSPEIDLEWAQTAKGRLEQLRSGKAKAVPGDVVFAKIRERFDSFPVAAPDSQ
ncbi:MAG: addiction module protein [Nitrospinae bacterium]|nr:addiction module protein [Nitrospinota bacterium]